MKTIQLYCLMWFLTVFGHIYQNELGWVSLLFAIPFWALLWDLCEYKAEGKMTYVPLIKKMIKRNKTNE